MAQSLVPPISIDDGQRVFLPCTPSQFTGFIRSLLGETQTIEARIPGIFELGTDEIRHLYALVDQRIKSQNSADLVSFSIKIFYSNESSILLNSLEEFDKYSEIQALISTGIRLSWVWLVKFNDKDAPEKQEITISAHTEPQKGRTSSDMYRVNAIEIDRGNPKGFVLEIRYTNRSWGTDLSNLLSNNLSAFIKKPSRFRAFVDSISGWIVFLTGLTFGLAVFVGTIRIIDQIVILHFSKLRNAWDKLSYADQNRKIIDYLINGSTIGHSYQFAWLVVVLVISIVCGVVCGIFTSSITSSEEPSFILLTTKAKQTKQILMEQLSRKEKITFAGLLIAFIMAIAAEPVAPLLARLWPF
ncbi:MAG TPA: hypothetical protein VGH03_15270 [Caulobacteraceae bacterium]|jgi:hypothetical protein